MASSRNSNIIDRVDLLSKFDVTYSDLVALGQRIGPDALNAVLETFGGQKIHVPTVTSFWSGLAREIRNEEIRARFRGNNLDELAHDYAMSEKQLRNVLARRGRKREGGVRSARAVIACSTNKATSIRALAVRRGVSMRTCVDQLIDAALAQVAKKAA